jgi:hypothetical protein
MASRREPEFLRLEDQRLRAVLPGALELELEQSVSTPGQPLLSQGRAREVSLRDAPGARGRARRPAAWREG